jgi:hypothetical protein
VRPNLGMSGKSKRFFFSFPLPRLAFLSPLLCSTQKLKADGCCLLPRLFQQIRSRFSRRRDRVCCRCETRQVRHVRRRGQKGGSRCLYREPTAPFYRTNGLRSFLVVLRYSLPSSIARPASQNHRSYILLSSLSHTLPPILHLTTFTTAYVPTSFDKACIFSLRFLV